MVGTRCVGVLVVPGIGGYRANRPDSAQENTEKELCSKVLPVVAAWRRRHGADAVTHREGVLNGATTWVVSLNFESQRTDVVFHVARWRHALYEETKRNPPRLRAWLSTVWWLVARLGIVAFLAIHPDARDLPELHRLQEEGRRPW